MAPSLAYMDRAYVEAREQGWSPAPIVEMLIPSTVDASLAPQGRHVASLFCQHFRYRLPEGRSWDDEREQAADRVIETVDAARAELQGERPRAARSSRRWTSSAISGSSAATSSTASFRSTSCSARVLCSAMPTTGCRSRDSTCAARVRIPGEGSRASRATTPRGKWSRTSAGAGKQRNFPHFASCASRSRRNPTGLSSADGHSRLRTSSSATVWRGTRPRPRSRRDRPCCRRSSATHPHKRRKCRPRVAGRTAPCPMPAPSAAWT